MKRPILPNVSRPCMALLVGLPLVAIPVAAAASPGPLAQAIGAGSDWTITAGVRTRIETIDEQFRHTAARDDTMISFRTTLAAEYDAGPVRLGGEVWDVRAYGQARNSSAGTGEVNALELVQAYVRVELGDQGRGATGGHGLLTAGRTTLDLGSRRLVARNRFRNTTNSFTGAHLDWTTAGGVRLQAFWAMPQIRLPETPEGIRANRVKWDFASTDLQLYGAHATLAGVLGGSAEAYGFGLAERDSAGRATRNRRLGTIGGRLFAAPRAGRWDHDVEAAWQFGKARRTAAVADTADLDVSAWFTHAELGHTFAQGWKPRVAGLFDLASGDGGKPGRYTRFDTLFGARRFDFGPTGLYGPIGRANVVSPGLRIEAAPGKRTDLSATWRALWLENPRDAFSQTGVRDAGGASGRFAGHQIEARVRHWLVPGLLQADCGAALLVKRGVLRDGPNAPDSGNTGYGYLDLQLTL